MKHLSQTLKIALALFIAIFANGTLQTIAAYAAPMPPTTEISTEADHSGGMHEDKDKTDAPKSTDEGKDAPVIPDVPTGAAPKDQDSDHTPDLFTPALAPIQQQPIEYSHATPTCTINDIVVVTRTTDLTSATIRLKTNPKSPYMSCVVSLNSYSTDGPTWSTSGNQVFLDHDQVTLTTRDPIGTLRVKTPPCYGQTDMYLGSNRYDGKSPNSPLPHYDTVVVPVNKIAYWNGGKKCEVPKHPICHRTGGEDNPYSLLMVDEDSEDGDQSGMGDIAPPYGMHEGRNWDSEGQFIFEHHCAVPAKPIVHVWVKPCETVVSSKDQVTVTITNPSDKTHAAVTYTVMLGSVSKQITLADGASGTVSFNGMAPGSYSLQVNGSDWTHYKSKDCVVIPSCITKAVPPVVVDCAKVTIPADTDQVHYVDSYTGTQRIVTATAQGDYLLDDGDGHLVKSIVFPLDFSTFDCGKGEVTPPTTPLPTPMELPHTGSNGISNWLIALVSAAAVYGAVYFAQPKRA